MRQATFAEAIELAIARDGGGPKDYYSWRRCAPSAQPVRTLRKPACATPISEGAFVGAAVAAAMGGLRPIVEVMLVDFIGVAMDALLNHASKVQAFSGGRWQVPWWCVPHVGVDMGTGDNTSRACGAGWRISPA